MGIKSKFCAKCGSQDGKFVDSLCVDCYFKSLEIDLPKKVVLFACPACDAVKNKGFWAASSEPHETYLVQMIIEKLKLPSQVELEDIKILQEGKEGCVELSLSIAGKQFSVVKPIELYVTDQLCDTDAKRKREDYEGVLQLRASKDIYEFKAAVLKEMQTFAANILRVAELENGADVYFLDIAPMRQLASQLKKKFNLYLEESAKAYSWDKTKDKPKYRVTILARQK